MSVEQVSGSPYQVNVVKNGKLEAKKTDSVAKSFFNAVFSRTTLRIFSIVGVTVTTGFLVFNPGVLSLLGIIAVLNIEIVISCIAVSAVAEIATALFFVLSFVVPTSRERKGQYIGGSIVFPRTPSIKGIERVWTRTKEKEPLGIRRESNNCWACALLQIIFNIPKILENIEKKSEKLNAKFSEKNLEKISEENLKNKKLREYFVKAYKISQYCPSTESLKNVTLVNTENTDKETQKFLQVFKEIRESLEKLKLEEAKKFLEKKQLSESLEQRKRTEQKLCNWLLLTRTMYETESKELTNKKELKNIESTINAQEFREYVSKLSGWNPSEEKKTGISPSSSSQEDSTEAVTAAGILPKIKYSVENIFNEEGQGFKESREIEILLLPVLKGTMIGNVDFYMNEKVPLKEQVPLTAHNGATVKKREIRLETLPDVLFIQLNRFETKNSYPIKKISKIKSGDNIKINAKTYNVVGKNVNYGKEKKYEIKKMESKTVLVDNDGKTLCEEGKALESLMLEEYKAHKITKPVKDCLKLELEEEKHSKKGSAKYNLQAFIWHRGTKEDGHYIAYVKSKEGVWYECDDHEVSKVSEEKAEKLAETAYFYIYEKTAEEPKKEEKE